MKPYESEASLVARFLDLLRSGQHPWGSDCAVSTEFDYSRGRTDVIAVDGDGHVFAFEAKLSRWRDALHQAYRNTCFAHRSYVVLPEAALPAARRCLSQFERRGIGLCAVSSEKLLVIQESRPTEPLQPLLSAMAADVARAEP